MSPQGRDTAATGTGVLKGYDNDDHDDDPDPPPDD